MQIKYALQNSLLLSAEFWRLGRKDAVITRAVHRFDFEQKHCFNEDMNCRLIDSVPEGVFEEISIDQQFVIKTDDYEERFSLFLDRVLSLIGKRKPIKYTLPGMPTLPKKIIDALVKQNYEHQILKSDNDFHFLVPR